MAAALLLGHPATAATDSHFDAGLEAHRSGDPESALRHFRSAESRGTRTPTLYYNLGVVAFQLGRLGEARRAFLALTSIPEWQALAHYNLGLVAARRGLPDRAREHFRRALEATDSPKIAALARQRLASERPAAEASWSGIGSLAAGYHDNVILGDRDLLQTVSQQEDALVEALLFARRSQTAGPGTAFVDVGAYYQAHADLDTFDFGAFSAAIGRDRALGDGSLTLALKGELLSSGGDGYAGVATARVAFQGAQGRVRYRLRNEVSYVNGLSRFDYVTGWRNRTRLELAQPFEHATLRIGYEAELNDRRDSQSGELFSSYSPRRQEISAAARVDAGRDWLLELRAAVYRKRYADDDRFIGEDDELVSRPRDQDGRRASVRVTHALTRQWALWGEYEHVDNEADIRRFDYASNRILLGLERVF